MESISKALQALINTPDDLTTLPSLVAKVQELESQEQGYLESIGRLRDLNKSYLAQIPIPGQEKEVEVEDETATIADAQAYLIEALGGNK